LARHWQAATSPANAAKAVDYSRRAGDAAKDALAVVDAARWYTQALELAERDLSTDPRLRCHLLIDLAAAQLPTEPLLGRATLKRAGTLAEEIDDPELMVAWALTRLAGWQTSESADPEVLRLLRHTLASVGDDAPALRARLLAAVAEETDPGDWRERRQLADAARTAVADAGDDGATLAVILMTGFMMSADQADAEPTTAARAVALGERARNPIALANALELQASASLTIGDVAEARRATDRLDALADLYALPAIENLALLHHIALSMVDGDLADLERHADAVLGLSAQIPSALAAYGGSLFELRWAQGRLGEIAAMFSDVASEMRTYAGFRPALVMAYLEAGELDQARSVFAVDASDRFTSFPRDMVWLCCTTLFAEAAIRLGDASSAGVLYDQLSPYSDLHAASGPIYYGLADRMVGNLAGFLGRGNEAERRLRHALDVHRDIGAAHWTARTAVDLAGLLLDSDGKPDGRTEVNQLLDEASRLAEAEGYGAVARRVAGIRGQAF
jgi:hypothetical protein